MDSGWFVLSLSDAQKLYGGRGARGGQHELVCVKSFDLQL